MENINVFTSTILVSELSEKRIDLTMMINHESIRKITTVVLEKYRRQVIARSRYGEGQCTVYNGVRCHAPGKCEQQH